MVRIVEVLQALENKVIPVLKLRLICIFSSCFDELWSRSLTKNSNQFYLFNANTWCLESMNGGVGLAMGHTCTRTVTNHLIKNRVLVLALALPLCGYTTDSGQGDQDDFFDFLKFFSKITLVPCFFAIRLKIFFEFFKQPPKNSSKNNAIFRISQK